MLTITDALDDPQLFGPWFLGPSWTPWRAVLKGAFALPMDDEERSLFQLVAERDPPTRRVRQLWCISGRRAGKDSIASAIAAWFGAINSYEGLLRPGESASCLCLAVDRDQAKIVLKYTKAYFERVELFRDLVSGETVNGLDLVTSAELRILANDFRSVRGRTIACAIMDEVAYWPGDGDSTDAETYSALVPGLATIPGAMLIGISSPYRRSGLLYTKWKDHYGKPGDNVLVIRAPSSTMNPTLDREMIAEEMALDPVKSRAEWLAEWRDDIASFVGRELIEGSVDVGVTVRPPRAGVTYRAFADPSGGVGDSFTMAIAHAEGEAVFLDCLVEIPAPFNPTSAIGVIASTLRAYGLSEVTGDKYALGWVVDGFAKAGIRYIHSERDRSAIYGDCLPLFTSGRCVLLDNMRLILQFCNLERRTSAGGDRIDHPRGGHDDCSNAAAGALTLFRSQAEPGMVAYWRELVEGPAAPTPVEVDAETDFVLMRPPPSISHAHGYSGREYAAARRSDGCVLVDPVDVRGFANAGFTAV